MEGMYRVDEIATFLDENIPSLHIIQAFIFGSVACEKQLPKDCDIYVVTSAYPNTEGWILLKLSLMELQLKFVEKFGLKLNILLDTLDEFNEDSFLTKSILAKKTITILRKC